MPFPYIFTFYSYKGGVGRSMALLNVGYALAARGRHVLLVDMDLEAPALSGFLERSRELSPRTARRFDGLSLLLAAKDALKAEPGGLAPQESLPRLAESLPVLEDFARVVPEERLQPLKPKLGQLGRLRVLGVEDDFVDRLGSLALNAFSPDQLDNLSNLLRCYFKAQKFPHRPLGLEDFEPPIPTPYDYILVDSRTGFTEMGGLCVGPLSDRLVVLTGLNDQNVEGTRAVLHEIGVKPVTASSPHPPWDEVAPKTGLGPKPAILVASPVPSGEIEFKRRRLAEVAERLGLKPKALSYHPLLALAETNFVRDYPEEQLAIQYRDLADAMQEQVADDPPRLAARYRELWEEKDRRAEAVAPVLRLAPQSPDLGIPLLGQLGNAANDAPDFDPWPRRQIWALLSQVEDQRHVALYNWGCALAHQAKTRTGDEAGRLFAEAGSRYDQALRIQPDYRNAFLNWGNALVCRAKLRTGDEAGLLFTEAGSKYAAALRLKPDDHQALNLWGVALTGLANTRTGDEAAPLFTEAYAKFAEALRHKPDFADAHNNWGYALAQQAKRGSGDEADRRFAEAFARFGDALRHKPDFADAYNNWGVALSEQAKTKDGKEATRILAQAREKLLQAEQLRPSSGAYNLACVAALSSEVVPAIQWLRTAAEHGSGPTQAMVAADTDFDPIRRDPEFQAFVRTLPEQ